MIKEDQFMHKWFSKTNLFFKNNTKKSSPFQITSIIPLLLIHLPLSKLTIHPSISIFLEHNFKPFFLCKFYTFLPHLHFMPNPWINSFISLTILRYLIVLFILKNKTCFIDANLSSIVLWIITLCSC